MKASKDVRCFEAEVASTSKPAKSSRIGRLARAILQRSGGTWRNAGCTMHGGTKATKEDEDASPCEGAAAG